MSYYHYANKYLGEELDLSQNSNNVGYLFTNEPKDYSKHEHTEYNHIYKLDINISKIYNVSFNDVKEFIRKKLNLDKDENLNDTEYHDLDYITNSIIEQKKFSPQSPNIKDSWNKMSGQYDEEGIQCFIFLQVAADKGCDAFVLRQTPKKEIIVNKGIATLMCYRKADDEWSRYDKPNPQHLGVPKITI